MLSKAELCSWAQLWSFLCLGDSWSDFLLRNFALFYRALALAYRLTLDIWGRSEPFLHCQRGAWGMAHSWSFLCWENPHIFILTTTPQYSLAGAFLIPYVVFFICCGIPVFFLETALGQFTSEGGITCWRKVCPLFEGKNSVFCCKRKHSIWSKMK